jgi:hypothetical protein
MSKKFLITLVLVILILSFGLLYLFNVGDLFRGNRNLIKVTGENYIFYTLKGWKRDETDQQEIRFYSMNGDKPGREDIVFMKVENASPIGTPTDSGCKALADSMVNNVSSAKGFNKSVSVINNSSSEGCRIVNEFSYKGSLSIITEAKLLWYKDKRDAFLYAADGSYTPQTSSNVTNLIKTSIDGFELQ